MFPNGPHILTFLPRDAQSTAGTANGYPFCQWEQQVTFNNGSGTAMELLVSPKEWVIAPGATQQLSPDYRQHGRHHSGGRLTGLLFRQHGGLHRELIGPGDGRSLRHVSNHRHQRQLLADHLWLRGIHQRGPAFRKRRPAACDLRSRRQPLVRLDFPGYSQHQLRRSIPHRRPVRCSLHASRLQRVRDHAAQYQYDVGHLPKRLPKRGYFLHIEHRLSLSTPTTSICTPSQLRSYRAAEAQPGPNCGTGSSPLYSGTRGICSTYSTPCWTYLAAQWTATNRLLGFSGPDESDANYLYPSLGTGVLGSTGAPSQITCVTSAPTTWNVAWSSPGPDISGPNGFIIVGATTHSQLNNTIGGAFYVNANVVYGSGFSFTGPSCASGNVTVTPATDPGLTIQIFAYEWDNNSTDYVHNTDYSTIPTQIHAGGSVVTGPVRGLASAASQKGWMGNCASPPTWGDYAEVYETADNSAYSHPRARLGGRLAYSGRNRARHQHPQLFGAICVLRAQCLSISQGTPLDYGIQGPDHCHQ